MIAAKLAKAFLEVEVLFNGIPDIFMDTSTNVNSAVQTYIFYDSQSTELARIKLISNGWGKEQTITTWIALDKVQSTKPTEVVKEIVSSRFANLEDK